jgi:hypothetical protein
LNIVASLSEQNSDGLTLPEKAFFRNSFETHPNHIIPYARGTFCKVAQIKIRFFEPQNQGFPDCASTQLYVII